MFVLFGITHALLEIGKHLRASTQGVTDADVAAARKEGATDDEIHDTVLITAAFCMFNRYVDGLKTIAPPKADPAYPGMGQMLATVGYKNAISR